MRHLEIEEIKDECRKIRIDTLEMSYSSRSSHIGATFSIIEILAVLYFSVLNIESTDINNSKRDKFILSKGHAVMGLYSVLANRGFFSRKELEGYYKNGSQFGGHPKRNSMAGIEVSTGSLGHGLAIGCGIALADKCDNNEAKTIVLIGDGECNEGSIWEAAIFAKAKKLNNLIVIIDYNKLQAMGEIKKITTLLPLEDKWKAFGFKVINVDGHDIQEVYNALVLAYEEKENPIVIIADTIKGKGVSFMEGKLEWHYKAPNKEEYELALKELNL